MTHRTALKLVREMLGPDASVIQRGTRAGRVVEIYRLRGPVDCIGTGKTFTEALGNVAMEMTLRGTVAKLARK